MTTVEILYRYRTAPTERVAQALARTSDVYGIRKVALHREEHTLRVEFDASRLNAAAVTKLLLAAGLDLAEELPAIRPPEAEQAPVA